MPARGVDVARGRPEAAQKASPDALRADDRFEAANLYANVANGLVPLGARLVAKAVLPGVPEPTDEPEPCPPEPDGGPWHPTCEW